jgi:two-component system invasion response regulator UvrY
VRILIADDHAVVRHGLKQILADEFPSAVFGEAATGAEVLDQARNHKWDLLVLDISLPDKSGLDVLKELKQAQPKLPTLVLSMHPEDQFAVRVLKAGAAGYLTKETAPERLADAARKAMNGGTYVSSTLAETLAHGVSGKLDRLPHETLSDREFEVACMLASGKSAKEIASGMSLSVKTVSTYRTRLLEKLHLKNNAELTRYALRHHLVD